jgi:hypothetical protein
VEKWGCPIFEMTERGATSPPGSNRGHVATRIAAAQPTTMRSVRIGRDQLPPIGDPAHSKYDRKFGSFHVYLLLREEKKRIRQAPYVRRCNSYLCAGVTVWSIHESYNRGLSMPPLDGNQSRGFELL